VAHIFLAAVKNKPSGHHLEINGPVGRSSGRLHLLAQYQYTVRAN
jgi:hypothetical protein